MQLTSPPRYLAPRLPSHFLSPTRSCLIASGSLLGATCLRAAPRLLRGPSSRSEWFCPPPPWHCGPQTTWCGAPPPLAELAPVRRTPDPRLWSPHNFLPAPARGQPRAPGARFTTRSSRSRCLQWPRPARPWSRRSVAGRRGSKCRCRRRALRPAPQRKITIRRTVWEPAAQWTAPRCPR